MAVPISYDYLIMKRIQVRARNDGTIMSFNALNMNPAFSLSFYLMANSDRTTILNDENINVIKNIENPNFY